MIITTSMYSCAAVVVGVVPFCCRLATRVMRLMMASFGGGTRRHHKKFQPKSMVGSIDPSNHP